MGCYLAIALGAAPAAAADGARQPISTSLTEDMEARYYIGDAVEDPYMEQVSRSNLLVSGGSWSLGAQVDEVLIAGATYVDALGVRTTAVDLLAPETEFPVDYALVNLEKLYATGQRGAFELIAGDFYASFGRGIALNIARRTDIDIDTSLRGLRAAAETDRASVVLLSGLTNPQQILQDNRNAEIDPNLAHVVTGARGELWALGPLDVGAHGVLYTLASVNEFGRDWSRYAERPGVAIAGTTAGATALGGDLDLFVELDTLRPIPGGLDGLDDEAQDPGWAGYMSIVGYRGPFVIQLEGKRYLEMEDINRLALVDGFELITPPTLEYERVITEDSAAAVNSSDIAGGRLRVDWSARPGETTPYLAVGVFRDWTLDDGLHFNRSPELIVHPVIGVQQFGLGQQSTMHAFVNGGLRVDRRDPGPEGEDYGQDVQAHMDLDIGPWPAHRGFELALAVERFLWGENLIQQTDYTELESALSWHASEELVLVSYLDYSDNPLVQGGAFGSPGNLSENLYGAIEAQLRPSSRIGIKAFYGAYKAGIRCSGGQCKQLPSFEGARLSVNFSL